MGMARPRPSCTDCADCADCTNDVEHCHGLLIVHDGWIECTDDANCPGADPVLHDARAACACCDVTVLEFEVPAA